MIYPEFLKQGDFIGVTAMSNPVNHPTDIFRFNNAKKQLEGKGYETIFTKNVFALADDFGRSGKPEKKAEEFMGLIRDPKVKAIISAGGGDFLAEMLPYVDLEECRRNPKWVKGYSDNTSILYYLTTKGDVATAYGANYSDYGMEPWQQSVTEDLEILEGKRKVQDSFPFFQNGLSVRDTGLEGYAQDAPVRWKVVKGSDRNRKAVMEGRLLGGCLDVLLLLSGTKYDGTLEFMERYRKDGIIWFLESFDQGFEMLGETLWKLRDMGWFDTAKGFVFGRPLFYKNEYYDGSPLPKYEEVVLDRLGDLNVPIITDADLGHKSPQFVWINGAEAKVECFEGKGTLTYLM